MIIGGEIMETYEEFINNILETRGRFNCGDEYHERHHIKPKCLGGTNKEENLVDLFAREHFIAHKLLAQENQDNEELVYAWWMMSIVKNDNQDRYELTPKEYEEIKKIFSETQRTHRIGSKASKETRNKISQAGIKRWESQEARDEQSKKLMNRKFSEESILKMSESAKKSHADAEWKRKMREANVGKIVSEETRKNMSDAHIGKSVGGENPRAVAVYCPELNQVFDCVKDVERAGYTSRSNVCVCLSGRTKHAGKHPITGEPLHWERIKNYNT